MSTAIDAGRPRYMHNIYKSLYIMKNKCIKIENLNPFKVAQTTVPTQADTHCCNTTTFLSLALNSL